MRFISDRFKNNNLFIILFSLTFMMIVIVSITITWTTLRMSEEFFINKFSITNSKVMNEVKTSFESFNYSIVLASNNLLQSGTIKRTLTEKETNIEKMSSYYNLSQQMNRIQSNLDAYEVGVILTGVNGVTYRTESNYWSISEQELRRDFITRNTLNQPKKLMYQIDHRTNQKDGRFIVASKAMMDRISGKIYGAMYFTIKEQEFRRFYSSYTSPGNNVFVIDKLGMIVSSNQTDQIGKKEEEFLDYAKRVEATSNHYIIESFMGKDQIILMEYLPMFDMYLFNVIDRQTAIGELIDKKDIFLISMAIVFVALIIVFFVSRRMTNSLSRLVKQISNTPKYDFDQYVSVTGTYETRQIGNAFNSMLDELHEYVEKLVLSQKKERNAELAALQQQINPHFLYNTLTSIKFMVRQGGVEETEATINALISLLQNTLGNVSETITIMQELDNLKNYVFINQKRYGSRIKVNYFVTQDCMDYQIPKLILQPFIENSFFHGFNRKTEGYINVLIWQEEGNLICEVVDNGDGMDLTSDTKLPKTNRKKQHFSGIGVRNVHERIQLIYGDSYGVEISSKLGEWTKVRISLPIQSI
jgi:two-component system, sensor histidine kinase YesM